MRLGNPTGEWMIRKRNQSIARQHRKQTSESLLQASLIFSLFWSTVAALLITVLTVFNAWTGYRGRFETTAPGVSFFEAWDQVPMFAGLTFVVSFIVLNVWIAVRRSIP